jgi:chromosome segregation ATPase
MGKEKKYIDYVKKVMAEQSAKEKAAEVQPILVAKLKAKMASLQAQTMEKEAKIKGLNLEVEKAYGRVTTNIDEYVSDILDAKNRLKVIEGEVEELKELKEDLDNIMEVLE